MYRPIVTVSCRSKGLVATMLVGILLLVNLSAPAQADTIHRIAQSLGNETKTHAVVLLGEIHRNGQEHAVLPKLLKDPVAVEKLFPPERAEKSMR